LDISKAYSVENGVIIDEDNGGPFYSGGTASPIGLDLPTQTFYVQPTAGGPIIWRKFSTGVNDWRQLSAQDIPFVDTGSTYKPATTDINKALEELRTTVITKPQVITATLNGTYNLLKDSFSLIDVHGTATGFSIELPDAMTLVEGRIYEIINDSSEAITIKDYAGTSLVVLNSFDQARFVLEHNVAAAGTWVYSVSSTTATGISSETLEESTLFATGSSTDVLITGFTLTPISGRYAVWFSSDIDITQNNRLGQCVLYKAGVAVEDTRRTAQGVSSNFNTSFQTIGVITVNGAETIDVRVNISNGTLSVRGRTLVLIRLGQ